MKILLVGEYNRTHWNLKRGLQTLGHEVLVIGFRDGFKKVDIDIEIKDPLSSRFLKKVRVLIYKFFKIDLLAHSVKKQILSKKDELSGYDVIQLVNESPFLIDLKCQLEILKWLINWNDKTFLLSTGPDYVSVMHAYNKKFRYSILTPYFEGKITNKNFQHVLSYFSPEHKKIHAYLTKTIEGIISNDLDYHIPLIDHPNYLGMIPHAIELSQLHYKTPNLDNKIVIFHGINSKNYYKKGNDIFEQALDLISVRHKNKIEIITVTDLKYVDFIKSFDKAHILLDQVYAYDQGFNALEAMAKGKVVFTGAEQEWLEHYNLEEDSVAINALPDAQNIADKLEWLILNPNKIIEISKNARAFVETHHDHINCAQHYLKKWST
ncbi:glycosyltransferase family 1 protein [Winogradskyella sp. DF17]|uniref:Glycosyltransferase family 1 protein n=1 Tax=Winogradskyella pelagia TaxID=2819984 RepID=A0ABS3T4G2_9FLAO|nr:glycosyltransferase [Winogradskyella sp. DF17]MBO3117644.1 glycosyltransferase family 1 protein [Winogradskyella sp. DF17]